MTIRVPQQIYEINATAGQIGVTASTSALAVPCMDGANHLAGWLLDGLIHKAQYAAGRAGTGRFYTYRHPNCDYLIAWVYVPLIGSSGTTTVQLRAGTGAIQTVFIPVAGHTFWCAIPWGGSGWQEVYYTTTDCHIGAVSMWSMARDELDPVAGADIGIDRQDPSYYQAGLNEGQYVIDGSAHHNIEGLVTTVEEINDAMRRQAVAWTSIGSTITENVAGWRTPAGIVDWTHRARQMKDPAGVGTPTTQSYRVYARTQRTVGAGTFQWRMSSSVAASTVTTGALVNAAATWDFLGSFLISSTADDTLTFEVNVQAGVTVQVTGVSVKQE